MTADCPTDYSYEPAPKQRDAMTLRKYWGVAKGLQAVDGLKPSQYMTQLYEETIDGKRTLEESGEAIRKYYKNPDAHACDGVDGGQVKAKYKEADLVSQRIAELLDRGAFLLAPAMLNKIHAYLFQDLNPEVYQPGQFKVDSLLKREEILNGDSVAYADPTLVDASLKIAFEDETSFQYGVSLEEAELDNLAKFISRIWQVHPFVEGNTRTVAVFLVLYLNDLGFDFTNEPFEHHSRYFRDALVRAVYRNPKAGVLPNRTFLVNFFDSVFNNKEIEFDSDSLRVQALFDDSSLLRNMPISRRVDD